MPLQFKPEHFGKVSSPQASPNRMFSPNRMYQSMGSFGGNADEVIDEINGLEEIGENTTLNLPDSFKMLLQAPIKSPDDKVDANFKFILASPKLSHKPKKKEIEQENINPRRKVGKIESKHFFRSPSVPAINPLRSRENLPNLVEDVVGLRPSASAKRLFSGQISEMDNTPRHVKRRKSVMDENSLPVNTKPLAQSDSQINSKVKVVPKPFLHRCYSMNDADIKAGLDREEEKGDLIGDWSKTYILPTVAGKHQDLKSIEPQTVCFPKFWY